MLVIRKLIVEGQELKQEGVAGCLEATRVASLGGSARVVASWRSNEGLKHVAINDCQPDPAYSLEAVDSGRAGRSALPVVD